MVPSDVLSRRRRAAAIDLDQSCGAGGARVVLPSFAARTLDVPICPVYLLGTHFLWHLLNATLLYLWVRAAVDVGDQRTRQPRREGRLKNGQCSKFRMFKLSQNNYSPPRGIIVSGPAGNEPDFP
jgi:hypothetical protein